LVRGVRHAGMATTPFCARGRVRRGAVRRGAVRCGAVCGAVRCGAVRRGAARRGAARRGAVHLEKVGEYDVLEILDVELVRPLVIAPG
jgi:hypothetical protein